MTERSPRGRSLPDKPGVAVKGVHFVAVRGCFGQGNDIPDKPKNTAYKAHMDT